MTNIAIHEAVKSFIEVEVLDGQCALEPDTPLITLGLLDSLSVLGLAAMLERRFQVLLPMDECLSKSFSNLQTIYQLIDRLTGDDHISDS